MYAEEILWVPLGWNFYVESDHFRTKLLCKKSKLPALFYPKHTQQYIEFAVAPFDLAVDTVVSGKVAQRVTNSPVPIVLRPRLDWWGDR